MLPRLQPTKKNVCLQLYLMWHEGASLSLIPAYDHNSCMLVSFIPQRSVSGLALFNIFLGNMDSGLECTLTKCPGDTKLYGVVSAMEGRDAIQEDLDRLRMWACVTLMKFKCKVLHLGWGNPKNKYRLGGE